MTTPFFCFFLFFFFRFYPLYLFFIFLFLFLCLCLDPPFFKLFFLSLLDVTYYPDVLFVLTFFLLCGLGFSFYWC